MFLVLGGQEDLLESMATTVIIKFNKHLILNKYYKFKANQSKYYQFKANHHDQS